MVIRLTTLKPLPRMIFHLTFIFMPDRNDFDQFEGPVVRNDCIGPLPKNPCAGFYVRDYVWDPERVEQTLAYVRAFVEGGLSK